MFYRTKIDACCRNRRRVKEPKKIVFFGVRYQRKMIHKSLVFFFGFCLTKRAYLQNVFLGKNLRREEGGGDGYKSKFFEKR